MVYPLSFYTYPLIRGFLAKITQKESKFTVKPRLKVRLILCLHFSDFLFLFLPSITSIRNLKTQNLLQSWKI